MARGVFASVALLASGLQHGHGLLRLAPKTNNSVEPVVMELENNKDMSFVGRLEVGKQRLMVIPDTGSFEVVILGDECKECGSPQHLFHKSQAGKSFEMGDLVSVQSYGSGQTYSTTAYATLAIGNESKGQLVVERQMFWLTTKAKMQVAQSGSFAGIFGLGAPSTAVKMAALELKKAIGILEDMSPKDRAPYQATMDRLKAVASFEKQVKFWHEQTQMGTFSICLDSELGRPGQMIFNDPLPSMQPDVFTTVKARGMYWSTALVGMSLQPDDGEALEACDKYEDCVAIMDTGTSLIGAPYDFAADITALVERYTKEHGCDDLSKWPDMNFNLGGKPFTLPPSSYVGKFAKKQYLLGQETDLVEEEDMGLETVEALMPHLRHFEDMHKDVHGEVLAGEGYCAPLVFVLDSQGEGGPQWLFGLPFFREYYTSFELDGDSDEMLKMHFTKADRNCQPLPSTELQSFAPKIPVPTLVDPEFIRFPKLAVINNKQLLQRRLKRSVFLGEN